MQAEAKAERQSPAPDAPSTGSKTRREERPYQVWMEWTTQFLHGGKTVRAFCAKRFVTEAQARDYVERERRCYGGRRTVWWIEHKGERIDA